MIHEAAIIHPSAKVAKDAEIGPWTIIGPNVEIGSGTWVGSHVVINGPTKIGENNKIFQFSSIGEEPQDKKFQGEDTFLEIGDNNVIREYCTLNRGTVQGEGVTKVGNNNLLMAYVHIAHDCIVHNNTVFSNNASLSGHAIVKDYAILSGFSAVNQFTIIGEYSFVCGNTMVVKDILPYLLVSGDPAEPHGINTVGLKRQGFSNNVIQALRQAYKIIYRQGLTVKESVAQLQLMVEGCPEIQLFIDGLTQSVRGIARNKCPTPAPNIQTVEDLIEEES